MIKMYIVLEVKYPLLLSDFNEDWIFSTDFWMLLKYQISRQSVRWESSSSVRTYRQTDKHDEANSCFSQFCERV